MAKSVEEQVLDKKTKEQIRAELIDAVKTNMKEELVNTIVNDVKESFNTEVKDNIKREISDELIIDIKEEINKEQRKLNRKNKFKIFRLKLLILILIGVICLLVYKLYKTGEFDYLHKYIDNNYKVVDTTTTTTQVVKDLNYYINTYGFLVDSFDVTNLELLKGDYNVSKIDITDKLAMVYNSIDDDKIIKEGIIYTVDEEVMSSYYKSMFGSLEGYKSVNFSVNGITYVFQESTKKFIAIVTGVVYEPNELLYEIINVEEKSGSLVITSRVSLVKENKLYNINKLNEEICNNTKEEFNDNLDKFSVVEYSFKYGEDGKYYINNISKK